MVSTMTEVTVEKKEPTEEEAKQGEQLAKEKFLSGICNTLVGQQETSGSNSKRTIIL